MAKELKFDQEARNAVLEGVRQLSEANWFQQTTLSRRAKRFMYVTWNMAKRTNADWIWVAAVRLLRARLASSWCRSTTVLISSVPVTEAAAL